MIYNQVGLRSRSEETVANVTAKSVGEPHVRCVSRSQVQLPPRPPTRPCPHFAYMALPSNLSRSFSYNIAYTSRRVQRTAAAPTHSRIPSRRSLRLWTYRPRQRTRERGRQSAHVSRRALERNHRTSGRSIARTFRYREGGRATRGMRGVCAESRIAHGQALSFRRAQCARSTQGVGGVPGDYLRTTVVSSWGG